MNAQEQAKALDEVINSVRDLETLTLKLPLGNPNLKLVHTNQFLFTELESEIFELINMPEISKALTSKYTRFSGYELNRWYIEGVTITRDRSQGTMELNLNPFATPFIKYQDNNRGFMKAYTDAKNKVEKSTSSKTKTTSKVKSTTNGIKLKNVAKFNKKDQEYIKKVVTGALKKKNYPRTEYKQMMAIYEHYNSNHVYNGYECMPKMRAYGFEGTWKRKGHNCGDGAATLCAMFKCAGFTSDIMHKPGHFYVRVKVNGDWYYCDQAGAPEGHNGRKPGKKGNDNNVFNGISSSASVVDFRYC